MKKFNTNRFIILSITILLFISGFVLIVIENETTRGIGKTLLLLGLIHILMLICHTFGKWDTQDYYKERLTNIREGHRTLEEYQEKTIAKKNEEIKKLKAQIKKMRTNRKL